MTTASMPDASVDASSRVHKLLAAMKRWNASDVFVCVGKPAAARVNGRVVPIDSPPTPQAEMDTFVREILSEKQQAQLAEHGDIDAGRSLPGGERYRFTFARQRGQMSFVARALPPGNVDLSALGLPSAVERFADLKRGLVLVTGATGSGKSTTIAAILHRINETRSAHIVTVEDPIEFTHHDIKSRVTQREVGSDTAAFDQALRQVVRQSPDVILVGEMRDRETVETALSAALTGHLVLSTLHTIDATQTLQRILSFFPSDQRAQAAVDLSMSLRGIVSQRLVPRDDGKGRAVAAELLTVTPGVRRLIREQRSEDLTDFMKHASTSGDHQTFNASLLALHREGVIDFDVGLAYASNADEFALSARGMSTDAVGERETGQDMISEGLDIKSLLDLAVARGASDLHLTEGRPPVYRISGGLHPLGSRLLTEHDMRVLLFSILTSQQRSQFELDREIDFALAIDDRHRFRVNAYYQRGRMAASLRSIATDVPNAEALGLPPALRAMAKRGHGLMLVVGPTGSGKSTTLACLIDGINRERACRILTVEDPIEFTHTSMKATVDQREVGPDTRSFAAALKYVLRQDPDVIMIGEMRDTETISAALTAAETGHLVLATLHTNDAIQAIDRVVDAFPSAQQSQVRAMLSASLLGVVSQRLLPRADTNGRVAAFEVLVVTPAIRNLMRENKLHQVYSTMETSLGTGMVTMDRSLAELLKAGLVRFDDAALHATNPRALPGGSSVT